MSSRCLRYVACDCCGNPGEACDTTHESRQESGFQRLLGKDICPNCTTHTEPCAEWLRERSAAESE